jgi:hypothetical protein
MLQLWLFYLFNTNLVRPEVVQCLHGCSRRHLGLNGKGRIFGESCVQVTGESRGVFEFICTICSELCRNGKCHNALFGLPEIFVLL